MSDLACAVIIVLLLLIIFVYWRWHIRPRDVLGYWRNEQDSVSYQITHANSELRIVNTAKKTHTLVLLKFFRRVCTENTCGTLDMSGRQIVWENGHRWIKEGLN